MSDAAKVIDIYRTAAQCNREDPLADGAMLRFPNSGQVVMTGDLHGHRRNFERLQKFCDLAHSPARHVVIHEIIHEEPDSLQHVDLSHQMLLEAARWKCDFPDQVHFLQSNHELAQLTGHPISKGGRLVTAAFEQGVRTSYEDEAEEVIEALLDFLASYPVAGRTANRIFLSHSLPSPREMSGFDPAVLSRRPNVHDLLEHGGVYSLVWGRYQTPKVLDQLTEQLDVDLFVCGHQPQEDGYEVLHDRMLIIASDHNHGVFLPFDLQKKYAMDDLVRLIRPFAAIE